VGIEPSGISMIFPQNNSRKMMAAGNDLPKVARYGYESDRVGKIKRCIAGLLFGKV
jgi:hypothetical protein